MSDKLFFHALLFVVAPHRCVIRSSFFNFKCFGHFRLISGVCFRRIFCCFFFFLKKAGPTYEILRRLLRLFIFSISVEVWTQETWNTFSGEKKKKENAISNAKKAIF